VPFTDANFYKDAFDVEGKTVLLTFGLLSPNKGLEHAIRALPAIVAEHPEVAYIILGATHPHLVRTEGESYRLSLQRLARSLGVEKHVVFYDRFVELDELLTLSVPPTSTSRPTPTVSRSPRAHWPTRWARARRSSRRPTGTPKSCWRVGRGVLTPFADPEALAQNVVKLLNDDTERHALRKRAYLHGRQMIWSEVAARYGESFARARDRWSGVSRVALPKPLSARPPSFPRSICGTWCA
jgi:glycosyltransferase involved in cell wall biosynthesis